MRKEITGTLLFFLVILTLVSIISFNWEDPSIHHAGAVGSIRNLFGLLGAHLSGLLIGFAGMGAFWIPVVLLLASVHFLGKTPERGLVNIFGGGMLLTIVTGAILSLLCSRGYYQLFGSRFPSGGFSGTLLKSFLLRYTNFTGSLIILFVAFVIGLILCIGFSPVTFSKKVYSLATRIWARVCKALEERKKAKIKKTVSKEKSRPNKKVEVKIKRESEIKIKAAKPKPTKPAPVATQEEFEFMVSSDSRKYKLPTPGFLSDPEKKVTSVDDENLRMRSRVLEKKLEDFGVEGKVSEVSPGPVITTFEYQPAPGVKINKIVNLTDDLALAMRAISIRIIAPIPGKAAVGIEIPNEERNDVFFKEIITSASFLNAKSPTTLCLGHDIVGTPVAAELEKMPHLLIAGATGAGKSVGLNVMISSILFKATPDDVRMIMIDPKRIELSVYDGIPHLITPVVTDMKKATNALFWAVREMERRYELLAGKKTRNITQYNSKILKENKQTSGDVPDSEKAEKLPYIVIVIDELADLMMVASKDVEVALMRLAQMARASGIHIVLATQRPSVDVLTGIIKANFPTRISFQVSSRTDSRTIIDSNGAETLLGRGDMLYLPPGTASLKRIHGAFISDEELGELIDFWKAQSAPEYDESILESQPEKTDDAGGDEEHDEKYDEAVALITKTRQASISSVQRHLRIGYNRAARIIETMEREGVIGPADGPRPREILVGSYDEAG